MAYYLPKRNLLFIHIPKTGGWYTTEILKKIEPNGFMLEFHKGNMMHSPSWRSLLHPTIVRFKPKLFTIVRNPISWIESWFKYNLNRNFPNWEPDRLTTKFAIEWCETNSFDNFMKKLNKFHPGFVTGIFDEYIENTQRELTILKTENLNQELKSILGLESLPEIDEENHNKSHGDIIWDQTELEKFIKNEKIGARKYGYEL